MTEVTQSRHTGSPMENVTDWLSTAMDSSVARVLLSWDTAIGVSAGIVVWLTVDEDAIRPLGLAAAAGAVAVVAVLATVVTLVSVLYDSSAFRALIERLGGRAAAMFPFWFHGYVAASALAVGLIAAAVGDNPAVLGQLAASVASGALVWSGFAMVGLTRHTLRQGDWKRRLEEAAAEARRRNAG